MMFFQKNSWYYQMMVKGEIKHYLQLCKHPVQHTGLQVWGLSSCNFDENEADWKRKCVKFKEKVNKTKTDYLICITPLEVFLIFVSESQFFNILTKPSMLADSPRGITAVKNGAVSHLPIARFFTNTSSLFLLLIWLAFLRRSSRLNSFLCLFDAICTWTRPVVILVIVISCDSLSTSW